MITQTIYCRWLYFLFSLRAQEFWGCFRLIFSLAPLILRFLPAILSSCACIAKSRRWDSPTFPSAWIQFTHSFRFRSVFVLSWSLARTSWEWAPACWDWLLASVWVLSLLWSATLSVWFSSPAIIWARHSRCGALRIHIVSRNT